MPTAICPMPTQESSQVGKAVGDDPHHHVDVRIPVVLAVQSIRLKYPRSVAINQTYRRTVGWKASRRLLSGCHANGARREGPCVRTRRRYPTTAPCVGVGAHAG